MTTAPSAAQLQARFAAAEQAMAAGELARAWEEIGVVARWRRRDPAVLRLQATVARRAGNLALAATHYRAALALLPHDQPLRLDYAGLLLLQGETSAAVAAFRGILADHPAHAAAWRGLGEALDADGAHDAAVAELIAATARHPTEATLWQALGAAARNAGDLVAAAAAFARAAALAPNDPRVLEAIARVEQERGRDARPVYAAALRRAPADPALRLGAAVAQIAVGDGAGALVALEALVRDHPQWSRAQGALARLRWQQGERHGFARGYEAALAAMPHNGPLWADYLRALARAGDVEGVYAGASRARAAVGASATLDLIEANTASEAGDMKRADRLFEPLAQCGMLEADLLLLPHWLRTGQPARAAALADRLRHGPSAGLAVPYLGTAWRVLDDPRAAWLDRPELVSTERLDLDLDDLAATLRRLHAARQAPLDQSLRGGTQTEGALFTREEPAIRALAAAAMAAVERYVAALPPVEPDHPFLSLSRGPLRFSGSWSVRLCDAGFHVAHVHSEGRISSACYVALPALDDARHEGWLVLGEPPASLGLALPPLVEVRPAPGLLALFPSTMWHGTRPFAAGERLTAAFDVVPRR